MCIILIVSRPSTGYFNNAVVSLHRTRFGCVDLHGLDEGRLEALDDSMVTQLLSMTRH